MNFRMFRNFFLSKLLANICMYLNVQRRYLNIWHMVTTVIKVLFSNSFFKDMKYLIVMWKEWSMSYWSNVSMERWQGMTWCVQYQMLGRAASVVCASKECLPSVCYFIFKVLQKSVCHYFMDRLLLSGYSLLYTVY